MNYEDIVQDLSEYVERFDCKKLYKGRRTILQIYRLLDNRPSGGDFRRQWGWEVVGEIRQAGKGPATIVNVTPDAPPYIKSLEDDTQDNFPILQNKIRCKAFQHEAKKVFRNYLSAKIKQLEEDR